MRYFSRCYIDDDTADGHERRGSQSSSSEARIPLHLVSEGFEQPRHGRHATRGDAPSGKKSQHARDAAAYAGRQLERAAVSSTAYLQAGRRAAEQLSAVPSAFLR